MTKCKIHNKELERLPTCFGWKQQCLICFKIDMIKDKLILELIKPIDERDQNLIKQILKINKTWSSDVSTYQLTIEQAGAIARELQDFPIERKLEVAITVLGLLRDKSNEIIEQSKIFPMKKAEVEPTDRTELIEELKSKLNKLERVGGRS